MRSIGTALLWALVSPVLLTGQSASGAERVITPPTAQQATSLPQAPAQATFEDVRPSEPPIVVSVNMGTLLHLPSAAKTVFVANPDVADVNKDDGAPDLLYLFGKKGGSTVLYAVDKAGQLLMNKVVEVKPGPVAIIRSTKLETGEPPPAPNFLVIPLQGAAAPQATAPALR